MRVTPRCRRSPSTWSRTAPSGVGSAKIRRFVETRTNPDSTESERPSCSSAFTCSCSQAAAHSCSTESWRHSVAGEVDAWTHAGDRRPERLCNEDVYRLFLFSQCPPQRLLHERRDRPARGVHTLLDVTIELVRKDDRGTHMPEHVAVHINMSTVVQSTRGLTRGCGNHPRKKATPRSGWSTKTPSMPESAKTAHSDS